MQTLTELYDAVKAISEAGGSPGDAVHYRHIPNSVGWPTEADGYSLGSRSTPGTPYSEITLCRDGEVVAVWDAGRWFTPEESEQAVAVWMI
jgi:hypothetical protein